MRVHDWQERLSAAIEASNGVEFEYGVHDCCLFAADCIEAVTGHDVAAAWRGQYAGWEDGMKLARVKSLAQLAGRFFAPVAPAFAWRGDVAIAPLGRSASRRPMMMLFVVDHALLRTHSGRFVSAIEDVHWRAHPRVRCWRVA